MVLEWLQEGRDEDFAVTLLHFGAGEFSYEKSYCKPFKIALFSALASTSGFAAVTFLLLCLVVSCFARQCLQIALNWLRQGFLVPRLRA